MVSHDNGCAVYHIVWFGTTMAVLCSTWYGLVSKLWYDNGCTVYHKVWFGTTMAVLCSTLWEKVQLHLSEHSGMPLPPLSSSGKVLVRENSDGILHFLAGDAY